MADVDFVVNCYERTYRDLLRPERLRTIVAQHHFSFARRTLLINNVADRSDAERLANEAVEAGLIDRAAFVEDHLTKALSVTRLKPRNLAPRTGDERGAEHRRRIRDWLRILGRCLPCPPFRACPARLSVSRSRILASSAR